MITHLISILGATGDACNVKDAGGSLLGLPHWFDYLPGVVDAQGNCSPVVTSLSDVWLVVAACIEILLRLAALISVGIIIYGGISYMTSQGEPDKTSSAKSTIQNALIGLAVAVSAAFIVTFIAGSIN